MRILQDGTVEIRNKKSGEVKIIKPEELPNYGIPYSKFATEREAAASLGMPGAEPLVTKPKELTEAQQAREDAGGLVTDAKNLLKTKPNIKTGFIAGPAEQIKAKFNKADQDTLTFNTMVSSLMASIAKARAGTSFTPNEEAMLKKYAPAIGDSLQELNTKLDMLDKYVFNKGKKTTEAVPVVNQPVSATGNPPQVPLTPQPTNTGNPIMDMLMAASNSAKQAVVETDPIKKQQLLQQSRMSDAEARGARGQGEQPSPLVQSAGKLQEFLGKSEALPAAYSTLASVISGGNSAAAGGGAAVGERLKQMLATGNTGKGLLEQYIPTAKQTGGMAIKGAEYAALNKILSVGGKYVSEAISAKTLNPTKIAGFMREKATEITPILNTSKIAAAGEKWAKLDPAASPIWDTLKPAIKKNMPTKDVLDVLTEWGNRTWTATGKQKDKAAASLMKKLYAAGRETIKDQAPKVAEYTTRLRQLKEIPDTVKGAQKGSWLLLKLLGIGKLL